MTPVTEKQAAGMWCPQARFVIGSAGPVWQSAAYSNRDEMNGSANCIGSRCMAWRWARDPDYLYVWADDRQATAEPTRPPNVGPDWVWVPFDPNFSNDQAGWRESEDERRARSTGYCGLAGAP